MSGVEKVFYVSTSFFLQRDEINIIVLLLPFFSFSNGKKGILELYIEYYSSEVARDYRE